MRIQGVCPEKKGDVIRPARRGRQRRTGIGIYVGIIILNPFTFRSIVGIDAPIEGVVYSRPASRVGVPSFISVSFSRFFRAGITGFLPGSFSGFFRAGSGKDTVMARDCPEISGLFVQIPVSVQVAEQK